jgi:hypothetical protein
MNWLLDRLKEKSSWLAIFTVIGLVGIKIEPELREVIINAILAVAALAAFVFKETPHESQTVNIQLPPIELVNAHLQEKSNGLSGDSSIVRDAVDCGATAITQLIQDYSPKQPTKPVDLDRWGS